MNYLLIRLEAPLMSFGGTIIDANGKILPFPAKSLLVGLLGNALGYDYRTDHDLLNRLQDRIEYAVRVDLKGNLIEDYQTVDLSTPHMLDKNAWTTQGFIDQRDGGNATGTHIRNREYIADGIYLVALYLKDLEDHHDQDPSLEDLKKALQEPARPLFIGRKPCLPSTELYLDIQENHSFQALFEAYPVLKREKQQEGSLWAWLPLSDPNQYQKLTSKDQLFHLIDHRDFKNQIFGGSRMMQKVRVKQNAQE